MRFFRKRIPIEKPEWVFIGLGNPGTEYEGTRHNVGFEVIDELSKRHGIKLSEWKFQSNYGFGKICGKNVLLAKPMTYMNVSGRAVSSLVKHFSIPFERLVVIYDDMDFEVGEVRIKPKGGPGTHNGMKSIIESLGTEDFPRIRIGIGSPEISGVEHVLSRFEPEEMALITEAIRKAADGCEWIIKEGISNAMNRINKPKEIEKPKESETNR
ncbi:MAG TPA: aminoacyl-tRNA hydrolase [Fimbriimonadales bacterium]|nr:aminoacyl-tRNA hydrolase [Fimbriimonadales bacterium]